MNQTSLSGSDVGKTGALFQPGNIKSKEVSDPGESKGFLDTLRALFRSESGSDEVADVSEANASETEGSETEGSETEPGADGADSTNSVESLLASEIKAESGAESLLSVEETEATVQSDAIDSELPSGQDGEVVLSVEEGEKSSVTEEATVAKEASTKEKAAETMTEGHELLERLDHARQVLKQSPGKPLPHDDALLSDSEINARREQKANAVAEINSEYEEHEELSEQELEYLAQRGGGANHISDGTVDMAKPETAAAQSRPSTQLQYWAAQTQQQSQQGVSQTGQSSGVATELNMAQLNPQLSQAVHPEQMTLEGDHSQPLFKSALTATGAESMVPTGEGAEVKESSLSQGLSGLAANKGLQNAQTKGNVQQTGQVPLQLSKDIAADKLAERVNMMLSKNLKNIDIRLDPPELGRMQIRMTMNHEGTASVQFTVGNQQAREVLEQTAPRLREMLAQQGVQLSESSVQQQSAGQQQNQYGSGQGEHSFGRHHGITTDEESYPGESISLDVNIRSKEDGISYYA